MSVDNSSHEIELMEQLLAKLNSPNVDEDRLDKIRQDLIKLEELSDDQSRVIETHNNDIGNIKSKIDDANKRLDSIRVEFDEELDKVNAHIDNIAGNRNKYIEYIFTLILGALVPSIISMLLH